MTTSEEDTEMEKELKAKLLAKLDLIIDYFKMENQKEVKELHWLRGKHGIADIFNKVAQVIPRYLLN